MDVLLLGSSGMLGQALQKELISNNIRVFGVDKINSELSFDLSDDEKLEDCVRKINPDIIINAAAIVDINLCENNPGMAYLINGRIPGVIAELCRKYGGYFVQISTDHYYYGHGNRKHNELDAVELVNEYARSKYVGEKLALTYANTVVLRTNIVGFRGHGNLTFVEWALQTIRDGTPMSLFNDFYTSSIHVSDFAKILSDLLDIRAKGIYNLASSTVSSKKNFILTLSEAVFGYEPNYKEESIKNIPGVRRGNSLGLDTSKIESLLGYKMPSLDDTICSISKEYKEVILNEV